jgi:hypothetical protein
MPQVKLLLDMDSPTLLQSFAGQQKKMRELPVSLALL